MKLTWQQGGAPWLNQREFSLNPIFLSQSCVPAHSLRGQQGIWDFQMLHIFSWIKSTWNRKHSNQMYCHQYIKWNCNHIYLYKPPQNKNRTCFLQNSVIYFHKLMINECSLKWWGINETPDNQICKYKIQIDTKIEF